MNGRFLKLTMARARAISLHTPPGALTPRIRDMYERRVVEDAMAARDAPTPAMPAMRGSFAEADMAGEERDIRPAMIRLSWRSSLKPD